jgi:3-deoxy-D-manno-octulosonic-acid transferase
MWIIYDLIIHLYGDVISVASLFNPKARKWVAGRKGIFRRIKLAVGQLDSWTVGQLDSWTVGQLDSQQSAINPRTSTIDNRQSTIDNQLPTANCQLPTVIWFHCASLGEFEQGRPVIEAFRNEHPDWKILLTFFSPSGYEIRKNYDGADYIFYLPLDSPRNASRFIRLVRPSLVVFVKYEFWFRYLDMLNKNSIPVYVISAIFRPNQHFFKWYGGWARKQLRKVTRFFVQDEQSEELLRSYGIEQVTVTGDTRFDRVASIAANARSFHLVEKFAGDQPVFLAGSTWPPDEQLITGLIETFGNRMKFIIAPHEVGAMRVANLQLAVGQLAVGSQNSELKTILFSQLSEENAETSQVLIIDGIGFLSHLYQYATIAYIGGGFGAGIHNILEAAAFGKPVIFGPKYEKFREAVDLVEAGGAFSIVNSEQLNNRTIELLEVESLRQKSSDICSNYVRLKKGATGIILSEINNKKY